MTFLFLTTYFIIGLLSNNEMKTLSGEEFYKRLNSVQYNFDVINCSEDDLLKRVTLHPMINRIAVPHHARKRLIAINKEEALKLQEDELKRLEEKKIFISRKGVSDKKISILFMAH